MSSLKDYNDIKDKRVRKHVLQRGRVEVRGEKGEREGSVRYFYVEPKKKIKGAEALDPNFLLPFKK